jgi:hypothetical protein
MHRERGCKKTRNEGRTHDLVDNRGPILGTHDVDENKSDIAWNPTMLLKINVLNVEANAGKFPASTQSASHRRVSRHFKKTYGRSLRLV